MEEQEVLLGADAQVGIRQIVNTGRTELSWYDELTHNEHPAEFKLIARFCIQWNLSLNSSLGGSLIRHALEKSTKRFPDGSGSSNRGTEWRIR